MTTSRGCPFSCSFCSSKIFWKNRYYKRTPKFVVDEIEKLIFEYGSKGIYFREDNFTVDKKHVIGICDEIISRNIKIEWECESRVDTIDRDVLKRMKEAGCTAIWCGVESGCQKTLDSIKKGYSLSDVRRFVKWCNELNIEIGTCYMLGFPDETIEDIRETFNFAKTLEVKWSSFATYFGFPLSELYEELLRNSLWEDKWEDVYIARNKQLTSAQLYYLEAAMNRDIRKYNQNYNETGIPAYKYYIVKIRQCFLHPIYVFNRIKTRFHINKKNINSRLSFNKLVDKFKKEKHESNP